MPTSEDTAASPDEQAADTLLNDSEQTGLAERWVAKDYVR